MTQEIASLLAVSFGVGIVVGMTGMGGGALMTPALIFLGVPPASAVANDLVAAATNKSVGAAVHWRAGSPHLRLAGWLIAGSVPTALLGAFIIREIGNAEEQEAFLRAAIGVTLLVTASAYALRTYLTLRLYVRQRDAPPGTPEPSDDPPIRPVATVIVGIVGGLLVGLTSVGSGSLMMVILLLLYPTLSAVRLVGTDIVQAIPLVAAAAVSHMIVTGVDWSVLIPLIVGGSPGTFLGARLAHRVSSSIIRRGITLVLTLTGLSLIHVPPIGIAAAAGAFLVLGPLVWARIRVSHGLEPFQRLVVSRDGISRRPPEPL